MKFALTTVLMRAEAHAKIQTLDLDKHFHPIGLQPKLLNYLLTAIKKTPYYFGWMVPRRAG